MSTLLQRLGITSPTPAPAPAENNLPQPTEEQLNSGEGTRQTEQSDLDIFKGLRDTALGKAPEASPEFTLDAETLNKAASQLNFTQGIAPELMQRAMGGDAEAFLQVLNQTNQNTFKTAVSTIGQLSGAHTKQALEHQSKTLKEDFTTTMATSDINLEAHPLVKEQVIANAKILAKQYPGADPAKIKQEAIAITLESSKELMRAMGMQVIDPKNPQSVKAATQPTASEIDWDDQFSNM